MAPTGRNDDHGRKTDQEKFKELGWGLPGTYLRVVLIRLSPFLIVPALIARHADVEEVFGFDQHFNTMGFILRP